MYKRPWGFSVSYRATVPVLDLAPTRNWRRLVPSWLRQLFWADAARNYDAFLSYSWQSDSRVAPLIQSIIQYFLRPWYQLRAKTVFRDLSCLPAGSSLEQELFERLDRSAHLIVLASPQAAHSHGMELEARHWFSRPRGGQTIVIVTSGDGENWVDIRARLVPPTVARNLNSAPLWIDLRPRREKILADPSDHQLREEVIEDLKQVLLRFYPGKDWGQLRGEEGKHRKRLILFLLSVGLVFLMLAIAAAAFAWYAQGQRATAERQARSATSRSLALEANAVRTSDPALGLLLARAAVRIEDNAQAQGSLFGGLAFLPGIAAAELGATDQATAIATSPTENIVAVGDSQGTVRICDVSSTSCALEISIRPKTTVSAFAFDTHGRRLLVGDSAGDVTIWDYVRGTQAPLKMNRAGPIAFVAVDPAGRNVATAAVRGDVWTIRIRAIDGSNTPIDVRRSTDWFAVEHLGWRAPGMLVVADWGDVCLFSAKGQILNERTLAKDARPGPSAYNRDGTLGVTSELDTGKLVLHAPLPTDETQWVERARLLTEHPVTTMQVDKGFIDAIAFSNDSSKLAVVQSGVLSVFDDHGGRLQRIEGLTGKPDLAFTADSDGLITLSEGRVGLWKLSSVNPIRHSLLIGADVPSVIQGVVAGDFSPNGKQLAWVVPEQPLGGWALAVWNSETGKVGIQRLTSEPGEAPTTIRFFSQDQVAFGDSGKPLRLLDLSNGKISASPCGSMLPGSEWVEEDNQKLAFRRCRGGQIETNNLLPQVTALGLSDKTCARSTFAEDGSRLLCVSSSGELIVANLRQHARTIIPLGRFGEGTSALQLISRPDGRRVVLHEQNSGALLVSTDEALLGNTQSVMRNADLGSVDDVAFSHDGHWLVAARPIGGISVWDAGTITLLGNVSGEVSTFHFVVVSPTGKLLAVLGPGGAATLWDLDPQSWEAKACEIAGRDLSESERTRYLPDKTYVSDVPPCRQAPTGVKSRLQ